MNAILSNWDRTTNWQVDAGLLFLRVTGAVMLFLVHGLPKALHYTQELGRIEDPFGLGVHFSLWAALLAEVICPPLIALGVATRLACLPVISLLLVSLLFVHPEWSLAEGQFGWLLLIVFVTIAVCGPGQWRVRFAMPRPT